MSQINDRTRYGREIMDRLEAGSRIKSPAA